MKITISAKQLRGLVEPMLPLAAKDGDLPVLNAVRLRSDGGPLVATASDRFVVGIRRLNGTFGNFDALIPLGSARGLLRAFRPQRNTDPDVTLSVEGDALWASTAGGFVEFDEARIGYRLQTGEQPDFTALIRKALKVEPADVDPTVSAYNAAFLGKFAAFGVMGIKVHPTGAAVVTNGDDFIGAIMPRRSVNGFTFADALDAVQDLIAEPEPAPKAAPRKRASKVEASA